jgi:hypothetical protein
LRRLDAAGQTAAMDASPQPDNPPIVTPDDSRWMTFAELAGARGISKAAAERLVRRHKWRRQPGNDGRVLVLVPAEATAPDDRKVNRDDSRARALGVIQAALAAQERAEARADRAESRADKLATELAAARAWADNLAATLTHRDAELATLKGRFLVRLSRVWRIRRDG